MKSKAKFICFHSIKYIYNVVCEMAAILSRSQCVERLIRSVSKRGCQWKYNNVIYSIASHHWGLYPTRIVFTWHGTILISAWIKNHMPSKICNVITYPFPNLSGGAAEVWKWRSNFTSHFIMDVMIFPWWQKGSHARKYNLLLCLLYLSVYNGNNIIQRMAKKRKTNCNSF